MVKQKKKPLSPMPMYAMLIGMTLSDHPSLRCKGVSAASVERASSSYEVEAQTSVDGSLTEDLFDTTDIQKVLAARARVGV